MTVDDARGQEGRKVVYTSWDGREDGVISAVGLRYVFVRFGNAVEGVACDPASLEFLP